MPQNPPQYSQRLPALALVLERNTDKVPADGYFYLLRDGAEIGKYRSLKAAKAAWDQTLEEAGWEPPPARKPSPEEMLRKEKLAQEKSTYFEYWNSGRRHSW
jgi:hypothetical protein